MACMLPLPPGTSWGWCQCCMKNRPVIAAVMFEGNGSARRRACVHAAQHWHIICQIVAAANACAHAAQGSHAPAAGPRCLSTAGGLI